MPERSSRLDAALDAANAPPPVTAAPIDASAAFGFLAFATAGLLGLYFLVSTLDLADGVVLLISIGFALGSAVAASQLLFIPALPLPGMLEQIPPLILRLFQHILRAKFTTPFL